MAETKTKKKDFLAGMSGQGFENMGAESIAIPRLSLAQQMSAALDSTKGAYVEGAKMGDFVLNLPPTNLGDVIEAVVLHYNCWWVEWPIQRGGAPIAHHVPGSIAVDQSNFKEWFNKESGNRIVETHDFVLMLVGHEELGPIIFNLTSTGIKTAKSWNTLLAMQRMENGERLPIFGGVWELSSATSSNQQGTWASINTPKFIRQILEDEYIKHIENGRAVAPQLTAPSGTTAAQAPQIEHAPKEKPNAEKITY